MNKLKRWSIAAWLTILSALGIQYQRPATLEHVKPVVVNPTPTPIANKTGKPVIRVGTVTSKASEKEMIKLGFEYAGIIAASECFKDRVLNAKFTENKVLSNQQIYNLFSSKEVVTDFSMFDGSFMQNYVWKTQGLDVGDGVVYANRFYIQNAIDVGDLILHEALGHGMGFSHKGVKATSVPYQLNNFYRECLTVLGIGNE